MKTGSLAGTVLAVLLLATGGAEGMTKEQQALYSTCHRPGKDGFDPIAWGHENWFCECKAHPQVTLAGGALTVDSLCLPNQNKPPQGGITGGLGGKVLWTLGNENVCYGGSFHVGSRGVPGSSNGELLLSWSEDFDKQTNEKDAFIHVTLVAPDGNGEYKIKKDYAVKGCAQNGGVVVNKRGDIAVLCMRYCETCEAKVREHSYDPHIVELRGDLSGEIRRHSVMRPECPKGGKFCYPKNDGADLQWLEYDPARDVYAAWHGGGWGGHVADVL
eukprot:Sspe_Gene.65292::Locus_38658_Transcript_1_1_Confidence_1.000_Length_873::g.65292::m.65292